MDLNALLEIGASAIKGNGDSSTANLDSGTIISALTSLIGGGKELNLETLISSLSQGSSLGGLASSLLGGSDNAISSETVTEMFDSGKISEFASSLGLSEDSAVGALSSGVSGILGNLKDNDLLGDVTSKEGLMGMASKFL